MSTHYVVNASGLPFIIGTIIETAWIGYTWCTARDDQEYPLQNALGDGYLLGIAPLKHECS
jgi:hypothetical protein